MIVCLGDHDVAATSYEKLEFTRRLKMLFSEGRILTSDGAAEDTYTSLAIRNAKQAGTIHFGDRLHTLWRPLSRERAKALAQSIKNVADVVGDRIEAEMHSKDLEMAFCCFDLRLWDEAKQKLDKGQVQEWRTFEAAMGLRVDRLSQALHINAEQARRELTAAALSLLEDVKIASQTNDNRPLWARVLGMGAPLKSIQKAWECLPDLVCLYLSVLDGECGVERDLAHLRNILSEHSGPLDEDGLCASDLLEVCLDGPACEEEVAKKASVTCLSEALPFESSKEHTLLLTDFTRACSEMWVRMHGRRFRCYRVRKDAGLKRKPQEGTFANMVRKRNAAVTSLLNGKTLDADSSTIFDRAYGQVSPSITKPDCQILNPRMSRFVTRTKTLVQAKRLGMDCNFTAPAKPKRGKTKANTNAPQMPLRRSNVFADREEVRIQHSSRILDTTMAARPGGMGSVFRPSSGKCAKVTEVEDCDIVIVEGMLALERMISSTLAWMFKISLFAFSTHRYNMLLLTRSFQMLTEEFGTQVSQAPSVSSHCGPGQGCYRCSRLAPCWQASLHSLLWGSTCASCHHLRAELFCWFQARSARVVEVSCRQEKKPMEASANVSGQHARDFRWSFFPSFPWKCQTRASWHGCGAAFLFELAGESGKQQGKGQESVRGKHCLKVSSEGSHMLVQTMALPSWRSRHQTKHKTICFPSKRQSPRPCDWCTHSWINIFSRSSCRGTQRKTLGAMVIAVRELVCACRQAYCWF